MRRLGGLGADSEMEIRVHKFVGCAWYQQLWEGSRTEWRDKSSGEDTVSAEASARPLCHQSAVGCCSPQEGRDLRLSG